MSNQHFWKVLFRRSRHVNVYGIDLCMAKYIPFFQHYTTPCTKEAVGVPLNDVEKNS